MEGGSAARPAAVCPPTWAHRRVVRGRLSCRALFKEELEAGRFVSGLGAQTEKKSEM